VVVPVPVSEILPRPWEPPTAPVKVTLPEPVVRLKFRFVPELELIVAAKLTLPDPVEILELVLRTTLPPKFTGFVEEAAA